MKVLSLLPVVLLVACAGPPRVPTQKTPAAAAAQPAATSDAAKANAAGDSKSDARQFDHIDASNLAEAQAAGYKVVNDKGNTLLCKKTLLTGTRLHYVTTCLTAMEWKETSDNARAAVKPNPIYKPERGN